MITYKYSLIKELKMIIHNYWNRRDIIAKGVVFVDFSFFKFIRLFFSFKMGKIILPEINVSENIVCYIVSCGTWGAYEVPNKIFICLNNLRNLQMSVEELILHEIVHLRLEPSLKKEDFKTKERKVNEETDKLMKK